MGHGLVVDAGQGVSRGGRPSPAVTLDPGLRFVGVDLGATSIAVGVTDSRLELLEFVEEPADIREGPEAIVARVRQLVAKARAATGFDRPAGIGIGVPGPVSFRDGVPVSPPIMPGWDRYPLRELFTREYGCPVAVDNDVNVAAVGERWGGVAQGMDNFLLVKIGTGIGSAIMINGHIHRGADGSAGDIGHIRVAEQPLCSCGRSGCLEATFGGAALSRDATAAARSGASPVLAARLELSDPLKAPDVGAAAEHGDPVALHLVRQGGQNVGMVLAGLVNFLNPPLVVVAGGVAGLGHPLLAEIRQTVYRWSLPLATRNLPIVLSELKDTGGVTGAVVTVTDQIFSASQGDE